MQPSQHKKTGRSKAIRREIGAWAGPAVLTMIALLYLLLSDSRSFGPTWFPPLVLAFAVVASLLAEYQGAHRARRWVVVGANTLVTVALMAGTGLLVYGLTTYDEVPFSLLRDALLLWTLNILTFALWFWELDNGGPMVRMSAAYRNVDLLFPQKQMNPDSNWMPAFVDYLFLAFNTNTAFSPTDTLILSQPAKVCMMLQSTIALVDVAVIVARAVGSLQT